jgi:cytochrome P450
MMTRRIQDYSDKSYDPYTAALTIGGEGKVENLFPELARMRRQAPIWPVDIREHFGVVPDVTAAGIQNFTALGYKEVAAILNDPVNFSNKAYASNLGVYFGPSVTVMDPPEHTRYRRIFQKAFLPPAVARWGDTIVPKLLDRRISKFAQRGKADLISEFALLFPFEFIMELMALPEEDREIFQKLAFGQLFITFDPVHGMEAVENLKSYLTELVHERREHAASDDDLVHELAVAEVDGERLPDDIVIAFFRQLMTAGGDTSYHSFSNLLVGLLTHPEQLKLLAGDRSRILAAIDEGLRWDGANTFLARMPTREVTMAGVTMPPGAIINVAVSAANHDETEFPDPDRFDITRTPKRHMAFGIGPHVCIGQHLARSEMKIALNALLDRLPELRLDPQAPHPVIKGLSLRAPEALHVLFG